MSRTAATIATDQASDLTGIHPALVVIAVVTLLSALFVWFGPRSRVATSRAAPAVPVADEAEERAHVPPNRVLFLELGSAAERRTSHQGDAVPTGGDVKAASGDMLDAQASELRPVFGPDTRRRSDLTGHGPTHE